MRIPLSTFFRGFSRVSKMTNPSPNKDNYIWIDLEMTGLEVEKHTILEVACIVTTPDLVQLDKGINLIINHPEEILKSMSDWSRVQHAKSGLTFECRESKISLPQADEILSEYIKKHTNPEGTKYIAGNSVYMDKLFLAKHMPLSDSLLSYRIIDVSSIRTLCSHWYPSEYLRLPIKKLCHRALDDILESIKELKECRKLIFK